MRKSLRNTLYITAGILLVIAAVIISASFYMLRFSLAPDPNRRDTDSTYNILYSRFPDMKPWMDSIRAEGHLRDTFVITSSGERRHAYYLAADNACGKTALLIHGYKDSAIKFFYFGRMYNRDLQYNILMPDLHGHGLSDGEDIQMGWKDADDVLDWIRFAEELFRSEEYESALIVHGVSMGAATTMNVSGKELPGYVNAFVEDCGYTSVWDEFTTQLKDMFGLPPFPLLYSTSLLCQIKYGWNFKEASPLESVSRCSKPMLFIHGDADGFVPFRMMEPLYEAKPEPKEFWVAPGSAHANAYRDHPEEYTRIVREFLDKWNKTITGNRGE
ncbi:MAG: alpha/beta hydrolase [Bacteroidales bacterium]|nr:alpha/beta hydrolase [Bacteroidales bacterium]